MQVEDILNINLLILKINHLIEDFKISNVEINNFEIDEYGRIIYDKNIEVFIKPKKPVNFININFKI